MKINHKQILKNLNIKMNAFFLKILETLSEIKS